MSYGVLAARSGITEPTVKRILGGKVEGEAFAEVVAIAHALGLQFGEAESDPDDFCRQQARRKAEYIARLVQGTCALENQAVDAAAYNELIERSCRELMAGSRRRLWAQ